MNAVAMCSKPALSTNLAPAIKQATNSVVDWLTVHFRAIGVILKLSLEGDTNLHASAVYP